MWRVGQCWAVYESWAEHLPSVPWAVAHAFVASLWTRPWPRMLSCEIPSWGSLLLHLHTEEEPWSLPPGHEHCAVCPDLPGPVAHQLQRQPDFFSLLNVFVSLGQHL